MSISSFFLSLFLLLSTFISTLAQANQANTPAADIISIYYHERPPYYTADNGQIHGLVADPLIQAFLQAGIPFIWREIPASRQLHMLENTENASCAIGWFKTPEREQKFRYSAMLYRDRPTVVLTQRNNTAIKDGGKIADLLDNPTLIFLRKAGYSYGVFLDSFISSQKPEEYTTTVDNFHMLKMLEKNRADYCFMAPEEAEDLLQHDKKLGAVLRIVELSDMPVGNERFLICNQKVSADSLEKINSFIREQ